MKKDIWKQLTEDQKNLRDTMNNRFDEHNKRFDEHDKRFDEHDKRFDAIDIQFDRCINAILDNRSDIEDIKKNMATKADIRGIHKTLDKILKLVIKNDQEITFMGKRLTRVEKKVFKI